MTTIGYSVKVVFRKWLIADKYQGGKMRNTISSAIAIVVGFAIAYAALIIAAFSVAHLLAQQVLVGAGSAILGAGLVFFLIRMFPSTEERP
jgi:ABC-type uncharacterized transport system permease subunit